MVIALKHWRHYLYGVHVDVFTHHKSLQYVFYTEKIESSSEKMGRHAQGL